MLSQNETIKIAKGLVQGKDYKEAEKVLLEAIEFDKDNRILKGMMADLYIKTDRLDDAEIQVEALLKNEPGNLYALQKKGDISAKRGDLKSALDIFLDIYKRSDGDYFLLKRIARVYYLLNSLDDSIVYANKAKKKNRDRADIYYLLFQIYKKKDETQKANEAIEAALKIEPGNSFYHSQKLSLRMDEKKLDSSNIKEIIDISDENNPHLIKLYADRLKKEGNIKEAIETYKNLMSLDDCEFNRKSLAFLYYKNREFSKAFRIFMSLSESHFNDKIFLSTVVASAKKAEEKKELVDRMVYLTKASDQYKHLWGKIRKLGKDIENEEN